MNKTIIYYTGNSENENFEKKIRDNILKVKGDLPLISVSQKPIDFGENICVGDVGKTYLNAFRQVLIGCKAAKTPFVVMAESDCLYPLKGYFDFEPKDLNTIYSYENVWIMWNRENRERFYPHGPTHGSVIYGRAFLINLLEESLRDKPIWSRIKVGFDLYKPEHKWEYFTGEDPIINIKTRDGVSFGTTLLKGIKPKHSFPYWGTVADLKKEMFNEV